MLKIKLPGSGNMLWQVKLLSINSYDLNLFSKAYMAEGGKQLPSITLSHQPDCSFRLRDKEGRKEREGGKGTGKERERGIHKHTQIVKHNRKFKIHNLSFA